MSASPSYLRRPDGARLAYHFLPGATPTVVFLGGYSSDMTGIKATHLEAACRARGQSFLRFDYRGHGASDGEFEQGSIGDWVDDARRVIHELVPGPLVLVGSSMGGWIMVVLARQLGERVHAMVGIAAAPDFSEDLLWRRLSVEQQQRLESDGVIYVPSHYGERPMPIMAHFVSEARAHLVLDQDLDIHCPIRLMHGLADPDVPWEVSVRLSGCLRSKDVRILLLKDGDHRLSLDHELELIESTLFSLLPS